MLFEQIRHGGCLSYLVGCDETRQAIVIDPALEEADRYVGLAAERGFRIRYAADTHTHADHFTATRELGRQLGIPVAMHRASPAPFVDLRLEDGDTLIVGNLRLNVIETPGHTSDSLCLVLPDRLFTGDTLLIGGTGRTDLPTGDPEALYDSLFRKLAPLDDRLLVFPAHDYKSRSHSSLGAERAGNPRLQQRDRQAFIDLMRGLDLAMPEHLSEALRTNRTGGKTVKQMIAEAGRAIAFLSMAEVKRHIDAGGTRKTKKPGTPKVAISAALVELNSSRLWSLLPIGFHGTGADTISQNSFSRLTRVWPSLPAMMAALTAPMEMPATHSGSKP